LDLLDRGLAIFGLSFQRARVRELGSLTVVERAMAVTPVKVSGDPPEEIWELAKRRFEARIKRDFQAADKLREELAAKGWHVRDEGTGYVLEPLT
jgi:cysteinyl-tRNA synthetase